MLRSCDAICVVYEDNMKLEQFHKLSKDSCIYVSNNNNSVVINMSGIYIFMTRIYKLLVFCITYYWRKYYLKWMIRFKPCKHDQEIHGKTIKLLNINKHVHTKFLTPHSFKKLWVFVFFSESENHIIHAFHSVL